MNNSSRSARTSLKQVPALYPTLLRLGVWKGKSINLDIGGGKYDVASDWLYYLLVCNLVYDLYNRSKTHNDESLYLFKRGCDDYQLPATATMANVLNVIETKTEREECLKLAASYLGHGRRLYISVYEGNRSGVASVSKTNTWQANRKLDSYLSEVQECFSFTELDKKNRMIIAWN